MDDDFEFGVEQEHFVLRADGSAPTSEETDEFYRRLGRCGFVTRVRSLDGQVLSVEGNFRGAHVVVTNDACTHIVELIFPPMRELETFYAIYQAVVPIVREVLGSLDLGLWDGGVLDPPAIVHWRRKESDLDGRRLSRALNRPVSADPLFQIAIPACTAASQVSLTILAQEVYPRLKDYYAFEFLVPTYFSNSRRFMGFEAKCIRPLVLTASFAETNPMVGVPRRIPATEEEYRVECERCLLRDYSFVAVRSATRLEFRSACSQRSLEDLVNLIRFRQAVAAAVECGIDAVPFEPRRVFAAACLGSDDLPLDWALGQLIPHGFSPPAYRTTA